MTTLGRLGRSGSLPPPFIVPQDEEPVTPEYRSTRSSSHQGRPHQQHTRPHSLPTGDTVSDQSTLFTSDGAVPGCAAQLTPQLPPPSTARSDMQSIPAACKQPCAGKRKAEDHSNSPVLTPLPDVSSLQQESASTVSFQPKQQKKENGASVPEVAQVSQPSPCAVTGVKQAISGRPEQSNAAPVANKTSAGNSGSESIAKAATSSAASTKIGARGTSENAVDGMVLPRRPAKGIVLPNKSNLIAAIREKRARNAELSCAASTIPPPCSSANVPASQQMSAHLPPPPKFVPTSDCPRDAVSGGACARLRGSLGLQASPTPFIEKLPPPPPSAWPAQHANISQANTCGTVNVSADSSRDHSNVSPAARPQLTTSAEQSRSSAGATDSAALQRVAGQQAPGKSSTASMQGICSGPMWGASISTSMQSGGNTMDMRHASIPAYSSAPCRPNTYPSAGSNLMQPPRPPPAGSLAFAHAHGWHAQPQSSHRQHRFPFVQGPYHGHGQALHQKGQAYHPGWLPRPQQPFHNPHQQLRHQLRPNIAHCPVSMQAPPQPHGMRSNVMRPPRPAQAFSSQPGTPALPVLRDPSLGMMENSALNGFHPGHGGAPWAGRGLV